MTFSLPLKQRRVTHSDRAGLVFPVRRIHRNLKKDGKYAKRISMGAAVFTSSVLENIVSQVLTMVAEKLKQRKGVRQIKPAHLLHIFQVDPQLNKMLTVVSALKTNDAFVPSPVWFVDQTKEETTRCITD